VIDVYRFVRGKIFIPWFSEGIPSPFGLGNQPFPDSFYAVLPVEHQVLFFPEIGQVNLACRYCFPFIPAAFSQHEFVILEQHFSKLRSGKRLVDDVPVVVCGGRRPDEVAVMHRGVDVADSAVEHCSVPVEYPVAVAYE